MSEVKWQTRDEMDFPTNALQRLRETLSFTSRDCAEDKMIAFMYGIILGWDDQSYKELRVKHSWSDQDIELQKMWHINYNKAWDLFMGSLTAASPVSDAVDANGKTWQEVLRFMRDNDLFDDKYDSKNLNFIYAFQMGFKSASTTPTNVQEQGQDEEDTWELFFDDYQMYAEAEKRLGNNVSIGEFYSENKSKYTITKNNSNANKR